MTLTNKLVLCGLLIGVIAYSTHIRAEETTQVVKITASKFHFTPDHLTLVKGQPVTLQLTSTDGTHGFLLRALKIDTDIKPGTVIEKTVTPMTAGTFKAICDHYCGLSHSGMKMTIVVQDATSKASSEHVRTASNMVSR